MYITPQCIRLAVARTAEDGPQLEGMRESPAHTCNSGYA